jgi:hypothetical protein
MVWGSKASFGRFRSPAHVRRSGVIIQRKRNINQSQQSFRTLSTIHPVTSRRLRSNCFFFLHAFGLHACFIGIRGFYYSTLIPAVFRHGQDSAAYAPSLALTFGRPQPPNPYSAEWWWNQRERPGKFGHQKQPEPQEYPCSFFCSLRHSVNFGNSHRAQHYGQHDCRLLSTLVLLDE